MKKVYSKKLTVFIALALLITLVGIVSSSGNENNNSVAVTEGEHVATVAMPCNEYVPGNNQIEYGSFVPHTNLEELIEGADIIISARVVECTRGNEDPDLGEERYVEYIVNAESVLKGDFPINENVSVRRIAVFVDGQWEIPSGYPEVTEGQKAIIFLVQPFDGVFDVIAKGKRIAIETANPGEYHFTTTNWPTFSIEDISQ